MDYKDSPYLIKVFDFDILHMELNTVLFTFVLVMVVMFFLNKWLFQPVLRTLDNRTALMKTLGEAVESHRGDIGRLTEEYEANLAKVREEVARVRQESQRKAQGEVTSIMEEARREAQSDFESSMTELRGEVENARKELGSQTRQLAEQLAGKIMPA